MDLKFEFEVRREGNKSMANGDEFVERKMRAFNENVCFYLNEN